MRRCWLLIVLATCVPARADVGAEAQWLWGSRFPRADQTARLQAEFELDRPAERMEIRGLADDRATLRINDRDVGEIIGTKRFTVIEKRERFESGPYRVLIEANNVAGSAGVWLQLDFIDANGGRQRFVTDSSWRVNSKDKDGSWTSLTPAVSLGLLGVAPWWRPVGKLDDYDQWKRASGVGKADDAARIQVVSGFEVELLRSSQMGEGSWISLTFDGIGRLFVGREGSGILRMNLSNEKEIKVETINDSLQECRGLLWAFDSLYANANNSKGLYRLRDTNGDDSLDEVTLLRATGGGVGHGRNALALGPDNLIYVIHGNNVLLSEGYDAVKERSPLQFLAEDRLRPVTWDRFMFDAATRVPAGYVARTNADGTIWQVFAGGFRNPYGLDFNHDGDLFTFDADNEEDQGTPWYRPNRFNHIVSGGDYGFRQGSANRPGWFAEHPPSNLDMGLASPTGVKSGHRGKFPAPYDRAMFVCDWSYGRIHAIHTRRDGASYRCDADLFLEGQPLNVTDLTFGPDGAMYFVTGGRGTQSGLYRVKPIGVQVGVTARDRVARPDHREGRGLGRASHALPDGQGVPPNSFDESTPFDKLFSRLGSEDVWMRHSARIELEHLPLLDWRDRVLSVSKTPAVNQTARSNQEITSLLAVVRVAGSDSSLPESERSRILNRVCERLLDQPFEHLSDEQQLDVIRVFTLAFVRLGRPAPELAVRVIAFWANRYPHPLEPHNQRLCELLAYLEWEPLVAKTMPRLESSVEQEALLAYLLILRDVKFGWSIDRRKQYFGALRRADKFDGGNLLPIAVNGIREDAVASLSDDERKSLGDLIEPAAEVDHDPESTHAKRPLVREWTMSDFDDVFSPDAPKQASRHDPVHGAKLYRELSCVRCHRFQGEGRTLGPDLTFVANRFGPRDLLEHIVMPSKVIDGKYRQTIVETKSGRVLIGLPAGGDATNVLLAADPLRPTKVSRIPLDEIESRKASSVSPMPVGLMNSLTKNEVFDLLEFLRVGSPVE